MILNVVAAIIQYEGKLFIARRPLGKSMGGKWEFPGGKIENGEPQCEALVREIYEELALNIKVGKRLGEYTTTINSKLTIKLSCFFASVIGDLHALTLNEHEEGGWCSLDDLASMDWASPDLPAVSDVRKYFSS